MLLATVILPDGTRTAAAAAAADGPWFALDAPDVSALLAAGDGRERAERALASGAGELPAGDAIRFDNPLPAPRKVVCCGLNYRDHIVETGREIPEYPTLFAKYADTLTGPEAEVALPGSERIDWEAELAVVVGTTLHRASREEAAAGILGYTASNDISARDWQSRTLQWFQGKAFDASCPMGPVVVTADAIDPAAGLRVECLIDGEHVQDGNTRELVFDAAHLVSYVSSFTTLRAGDIVLSGTPGGVGMGMSPQRFLRDGELLETRIEGIGTLRTRIRADAGPAAG